MIGRRAACSEAYNLDITAASTSQLSRTIPKEILFEADVYHEQHQHVSSSGWTTCRNFALWYFDISILQRSITWRSLIGTRHLDGSLIFFRCAQTVREAFEDGQDYNNGDWCIYFVLRVDVERTRHRITANRLTQDHLSGHLKLVISETPLKPYNTLHGRL